jgi:tetraacyldisaccharide 4'-kinase
MSENFSIWKIILLGPLSFVYGVIVWLRNFLYDHKVLKSKEYEIPIISIGNISVGGTGKTPHTEYLLRMLNKEFSIAVLSRGYKRKTKGFRFVETNSTALESGDEPLQIKKKFPDAIVAVDANRTRGIETLLEKFPDLNLIIMDDAFQHRRVKSGLSILLNNFSHPISKDFLLPLGRLREGKSSVFRSHIIIVSKCPYELKPIERRIMHKEMEVLPYQYLFFSTLKYKTLKPVFPDVVKVLNGDFLHLKKHNVLAFTGIAKSENFIEYLQPKCQTLKHLKFSDHRNFTLRDIKLISKNFEALNNDKLIITTEKDAVRLKTNSIFPDELKKHFYYLPIEIELLISDDEKQQFDNQIFSYVRNNKRYSKLYKNAYSG